MIVGIVEFIKIYLIKIKNKVLGKSS